MNKAQNQIAQVKAKYKLEEWFRYPLNYQVFYQFVIPPVLGAFQKIFIIVRVYLYPAITIIFFCVE